MIDLLTEWFALSESVEAHGKEWLIVRHLRKDYYIAVEKGAVPPTPLQLIRYVKPETEKGSGDE